MLRFYSQLLYILALSSLQSNLYIVNMEKFLKPLHASKGNQAKSSINQVLKMNFKARLNRNVIARECWTGNILQGKQLKTSGPSIHTQNYSSECFSINRSDPCAAGFDIVLEPGYFVNLPLRRPTIIETDIEMIPNFARHFELRTNSKLLVRGFEVRPGVIDSNYTGKLKIIIEHRNKDWNVCRGHHYCTFVPGDSIAQLVSCQGCNNEIIKFVKVPESDMKKHLSTADEAYEDCTLTALEIRDMGVKCLDPRRDGMAGSTRDQEMITFYSNFIESRRPADSNCKTLRTFPKLETVRAYFIAEALDAWISKNQIDLTEDTQDFEDQILVVPSSQPEVDSRDKKVIDWDFVKILRFKNEDRETAERYVQCFETRLGKQNIKVEIKSVFKNKTEFKLYADSSMSHEIQDVMARVEETLQLDGYRLERLVEVEDEAPLLKIQDIKDKWDSDSEEELFSQPTAEFKPFKLLTDYEIAETEKYPELDSEQDSEMTQLINPTRLRSGKYIYVAEIKSKVV